MTSLNFPRRSILAALFAIAGWSGVRWLENYVRDRVFPRDITRITDVNLGGVEFKVMELFHDDGTALRGLVSRSTQAKASVVYLHGNGGNAEKAAAESAMLVARGYDVFVADYRGYGGNGGEPSERGLIEDATLFARHALAHSNGRPVILVGHSMGGALAIMLASRLSIAGLLTWGAVARLSDLIPPIGRLFFQDQFNALDAASSVRVPWLIVHGDDDDVVPLSDAHRLKHTSTAGAAELLILNGDHVVDSIQLAEIVDRLFGRIQTIQ